jgi:excisionase family DNA binding protein
MMSSSEIQSKPEVTGRLLTPEDVATRLGVSPSWVRKRAQAGVLPYRRVGRQLRFIAREIDAWVESQH